MSSPLRDRLREDMKTAMRAKDKERTTVLRGMMSAITYADKATGVAVDDERARQALRQIGTVKPGWAVRVPAISGS